MRLKDVRNESVKGCVSIAWGYMSGNKGVIMSRKIMLLLVLLLVTSLLVAGGCGSTKEMKKQ